MTLDECRLFYADEIKIAARVDSPALVAAYARVPREVYGAAALADHNGGCALDAAYGAG